MYPLPGCVQNLKIWNFARKIWCIGFWIISTKHGASSQKLQFCSELENFNSSDVPKNFDARQKWPNCPSISNVPNQGGCGSCFAVAAAGVASDRACIHSNGTFKSLLSEEDIIGCCSVCGNCYGGDPLKALTYWVNQGLVTGKRWRHRWPRNLWSTMWLNFISRNL